MTTLFIGTYTRNTGAEGIYACDWDPISGRFADLTLAARADNPSFLVAHRNSVFAVQETADYAGEHQGGVAQYRRTGMRLDCVALRGTGGADPCHLAAVGARLAVTNYSGASVALFDLVDDLLTGSATMVHFAGRGPGRRQAEPHPHGVYFSGAELLVPDLGTDRIHRLDPTTGSVRGAWPVAPGSGPRHLALGGAGRVYLLNELANRIDVLAGGIVIESVATLPEGIVHATGTGSASMAGGIALSRDGRHLLASNRAIASSGGDSLVGFPVDPSSGLLGAPKFTACGAHPRHFLAMDDWVIVASRDAGTLTAFERWPDGSLGRAVATLPCPAPVCVLAVP